MCNSHISVCFASTQRKRRQTILVKTPSVQYSFLYKKRAASLDLQAKKLASGFAVSRARETMPNWCTITLSIHGSDADVEAFRSKWGNKKCMKFSDFLPLPPEKEDDWYNWQNQNWGTKWDLAEDSTEVCREAGGLTVSSITAWCPPIAFLNAITKMYPTLVFGCSYHEPAMMFCGYQEWKNGERVLRIHKDYRSNRHLLKLLDKYDGTVTSAWWGPDSDSGDEEEDEEDEDDSDEEEADEEAEEEAEEDKADEKIESAAEQS